MVTWLSRGALFLAVFPIGGAVLAGLHPAFDSFGVGLFYGLGLAALALLLFAGTKRMPGALLAVLTLIAGATVLWPVLRPMPTSEGTPLRLLQHNLNLHNTAPDLARRMAAADIVTLQEVRAAEGQLDALPDGWTAHACPFTPLLPVTVATRWPVLDRGCLPGGAWLRVDSPGGAVTVLSLHLHWPWPLAQAEQVADLLPLLRALPRPVVVAGDFNQTPWSHSVTQIARATGTRVTPGLRTTLLPLGRLLPLPIDHVLVTNGGAARVTRGPQSGSDHFAILAEITLPERQ